MLCVDSSRLCMSGVSSCDLCLCYSILGSQFSNKHLLTNNKLKSFAEPHTPTMCIALLSVSVAVSVSQTPAYAARSWIRGCLYVCVGTHFAYQRDGQAE